MKVSKKNRPAGYIFVHESPVTRDMESMKTRNPELYEMMHKDFRNIVSYDFFVDKKNKRLQDEIRDCLYQIDCPKGIAFQKTLKKHYAFVGSEDTGHISEFNDSVEQLVQTLVIERDFEMVYDEDMERNK